MKGFLFFFLILLGALLLWVMRQHSPSQIQSPVSAPTEQISPATAFTEEKPMTSESLESLLKTGKRQEAIGRLEQDTQKNPEDTDSLNLLGNLYLMEGKLQEALAVYNTCLDLAPDNAGFWNNRGMVHLQLGKTDTALEDFHQALAFDPKATDAHFNLALIYSENQRFKKALEHLNQVLALQPDHAKAYYRRGAVKMAAGQLDHALQDYQAALVWQPKWIEPRADMGFALLQKKDHTKALQAFDTVLQQDSAMDRAWYGKGLALRAQGHHKDALPAFQEAARLMPDKAQVHVELGFAYLAALGPDGASTCELELQKALLLTPKDIRVNYMTAVFYDDMNRPQEAIPYYQKTVMLDATHTKARLYLAESFLKIGDAGSARPHLETLIQELPPENPLRKQAQTLLTSNG